MRKFTGLMRSIKEKLKFNLGIRGSYTVEACLILPIVLIGILTIGILSKSYYTDFKAKTQIDDELRLSMVASGITQVDTGLSKRVESRLTHEGNGILEKVFIDKYSYGFNKLGINSLIGIKVNYIRNIKIPFMDAYSKLGSEQALGRMFVGDKNERNIFPFDKMEKDEKTAIVYIFPTDGRRYHKEKCSYVEPKITVERLETIDLKRYRPCHICGAKNISQGEPAYIFENYGDYYHKKSCNTIYKNVVKTTVSDAEAKGYTKCSKCNP